MHLISSLFHRFSRPQKFLCLANSHAVNLFHGSAANEFGKLAFQLGKAVALIRDVTQWPMLVPPLPYARQPVVRVRPQLSVAILPRCRMQFTLEHGGHVFRLGKPDAVGNVLNG